MSKFWFSLCLVVGGTLATTPEDAAAGHRHGGGCGGYGGGYGGYYGGYGGCGGYGGGYGGYYGGYRTGGYYAHGYGLSGYNYAPSGYSYGPSYSSTNYSTGSSTYGSQMGSMVIRVPAENAEIWVDGTKTRQRGLSRSFQFAHPTTLQNASYHIKVRWQGDNGDVEQTRVVRIQPGQPVNVTFRAGDLAAEEAAEPNARQESSHIGTFVSATGQDFVMETNGKEHTHALADNARIYDATGKQCNLTDLKNGERIRVTTKGGDNKTATKVEVLKKKV